MIVTTPAIAAAFRLATTLPTRRHAWSPPTYNYVGSVPRLKTERRRAQIRLWLREKPTPTYSEMAARLDISRTAVADHVRAIKHETTTRRPA
jgi:hypothetical protein